MDMLTLVILVGAIVGGSSVALPVPITSGEMEEKSERKKGK